jgi:hypothetical protein
MKTIPDCDQWWEPYNKNLLPALVYYLPYETTAESIMHFSAQAVPGIIQTERYAKAMLCFGGQFRLSDKSMESCLRVRMKRQWCFFERQDRHKLELVIDEAALHRHVISGEVLKEQLIHLLEISKIPEVCLRILPFYSKIHPMTLPSELTITQHSGSPKNHDVFLGDFLEPRHESTHSLEVIYYQIAFANLKNDSLSEAQSRALIRQKIRTIDDE